MNIYKNVKFGGGAHHGEGEEQGGKGGGLCGRGGHGGKGYLRISRARKSITEVSIDNLLGLLQGSAKPNKL